MAGEAAPAADIEYADHLRSVAKAIIKGKVVPVLGAGANLCDRAPDEAWTPGANLPSGAELAALLAKDFDYYTADRSDLLRVSQWAEVTMGSEDLYEQLRAVFAIDYPIPSLHAFLAGLPAWIEHNGRTPVPQLILTTNYDDLAERALRAKGIEFDIVRYVSKGPNKGMFVHELPDGSKVVIKVPNEYDAVDSEVRTVVMKIHGNVDRKDEDDDSYVITEDDYIEYLVRSNPSELIPAKLLDKLVHSHLLFLGYGMRDWNLRVILHRIWALRERSSTSWAVQEHVDRLEAKLWKKREVELQERRLSDYVAALTLALEKVIA